MRMPLKDRLGSDIKRVEADLMAAKHAAVKPSGLTVPQFAALLILEDSPGISPAELARRCRVTPQTMTTVLQNLTTRGFIERTAHPFHRSMLETRLTETGATTLAEADQRASAVERRLADAFTESERATLRALLDRCSEALTGE
ncbi:DNA-binding MarR family transcriptional regulator [Herbihabitans rhizosphaerae]|uniref:DNA-binding MarR family transcriptional regulator n=1 Tax=Herbihabitans rhizosphaerae TaxID=1872711 RepID=A0A4Q7KMU1_9PSEU|nr:MarR family transcriptional regulator [Herbihabitans rhizosphaerae]RZS37636.1 DNA-binding MarR family transcriptional regulator [Herbihabitans rhizosphaerae]